MLGGLNTRRTSTILTLAGSGRPNRDCGARASRGSNVRIETSCIIDSNFPFYMLQTQSRALHPRTGLETALEKSRTALCRMAKPSAAYKCSCMTALYRYKCTVMSNGICTVQCKAVLLSMCASNKAAIVEPVSEAHPRQRRPRCPAEILPAHRRSRSPEAFGRGRELPHPGRRCPKKPPRLYCWTAIGARWGNSARIMLGVCSGRLPPDSRGYTSSKK